MSNITDIRPTPKVNILPRVTSLEILTQNTQFRPAMMDFLEDTIEQMERAASLGNAIQTYDFVATQETFDDDPVEQLMKDVKSTHPYQYRIDNGNLVLQDSGLTNFSKYPIIKTAFHQFSESVSDDWWSRKGVSLTRINIPNVGPVDIYNTHTQANYGRPGETNKYTNVQTKQLKELANFVKAHDQGYPIMIMGDFNMVENSRQYQELKQNLPGFQDAYRTLHRNEDPGYTLDPVHNSKADQNESPQRLDYIFFRSGHHMDMQAEVADVVNKEAIQEKCRLPFKELGNIMPYFFNKLYPGHTGETESHFISDHFGLHVKFNFTPVAP